MFRIDRGGGAPKVTVDLINSLKKLGMEVHLLTPFRLDYNKIEQLYEKANVDKKYDAGKIKSPFCREEYLGRKLMIKKFQQMAKEVDFIIDIDGGVFHNYLPKEFDKKKYVIWRLSCLNQNTWKLQNYINLKMIIKKVLRNFSFKKGDIPEDMRIYAVDEWTKRELIENWGVTPQKTCLYVKVPVENFLPNKKKINQIVILGRIAPNKSLEDSIKIFANGTEKNSDYKLKIIGGMTPDSEEYIQKLNELIKELHIGEKVEIIKDPSFEQIRDILSESKILIDSQIGTSMNIPPIEAMASGCIVLMQKNSGTYTELLGKGDYGYGFENSEDGAKKLKEIITELEKGIIDNKKSIKRAWDFSGARFDKTLGEILYER